VTNPQQPKRGKATARFAAIAAAVLKADSGWREKRNSAPFPLFRWLAALGILLWTATGSTHTISGWAADYAPWLILAGALAFGPEIASIRFGGFRLDVLTGDVRELRGQVQQLQLAQASAVSASTASASAPVQVIVQTANRAGEITTAREGVTPAADLLGRYVAGGRAISSTETFASPAGVQQASTIAS
jgi:hypothetical protein